MLGWLLPCVFFDLGVECPVLGCRRGLFLVRFFTHTQSQRIEHSTHKLRPSPDDSTRELWGLLRCASRCAGSVSYRSRTHWAPRSPPSPSSSASAGFTRGYCAPELPPCLSRKRSGRTGMVGPSAECLVLQFSGFTGHTRMAAPSVFPDPRVIPEWLILQYFQIHESYQNAWSFSISRFTGPQNGWSFSISRFTGLITPERP